MGDVQKWLSVKVQRALGLESPAEGAAIVDQIRAKTDAREIEATIKEWLGSDDTVEEIINEYFKKISMPRFVEKKEAANVYEQAAKSRTVAREAALESQKDEDDDLGYGALAKPKKKKNRTGNRDNYQHVDLGPDGRSMQGGNLTVVKKRKKGAKTATSDAAAYVIHERAICGCQARLHPFVNNCLRCGRIVCLQEDVGPCFYCGHTVTPQGTPQLPPFTSRTSTTPTPTPTPTPGGPQGKTTKTTEEERMEAERATAGLKRAQDNLSRLLAYDRTMAERTTVYDDQADYFDMSNRWISADERKKLAQKEAALLKSKQTATAQIVLDFAGRTVVATSQSSGETHQKFKDQLVEQMQMDQAKQKMMDREEAEEHQRAELERIKGHLKQRPDGTIFVVPAMDIPAPEFVARHRENAAPASKGAKKSAAPASQSNKSQAPQSISAATGGSTTSPGSGSPLSSSSASIPTPSHRVAHSRLQTDFYPEVEIDNFDMLDDVVESVPEAGVVVNAKQDSASSVQVRGVVESFPGKPWTPEDRVEMIEWMQAQGGNFYMWAPFDDPMHRRLWNHLFSDDEVMNMKATMSKCTKLGVEFNLAIRPHAIDFRSLLHTDALARKILQAYEQFGCRSFSILFSEEDRSVPQGCRSLAAAQTELVNTLVQVVDEFVKLKTATDDSSSSAPAEEAPKVRWLFAPTMNTSQLETGQGVATLNYLRELNKNLDKRFELLWSGPELPSASIDNTYLTKLQRFFGNRSLFFWDRLPQCPAPYELPTLSADAFDYALHQNQFIEVYRRRSPIMGNYFAGGLVSTMSAPVPSRVMLATALQFFKDASSYNPDNALVPILQEHILTEKTDSVAAALSALIRLIPTSPMTKAIRQPGALQGEFNAKDERAFYVTLRSNLSKVENAPKVFPHREQFAPMLNMLREVADMNLAYLDFQSNPKGGAAAATKAIRALRNSLIPVLYTEYDLAQYRTVLFAYPIPDKSLRGDVQRTYTKFKAANSITPKDGETKDLVVRLATEATISMRELETYLISDYNAVDIKAWRIFLNHLFYRADTARGFLYKIPPITSPAATSPNIKILEQRNTRIKARLVEEERLRSIALKFKVTDPKTEDSDSEEDDDPRAPSSSQPSSSNAAAAPAPAGAAKKLFPTEVKKLPVPGMRYIRDFLTPEQEASLLADIDAREWDTELARRVQQYGYKFEHRPADKGDKNDARLEIGAPLPQFVKDIGDMLANGKYVEKPDQVIINEYKPGQGIRQHIDNPAAYDDGIVSISLGSPVVMEFEHKESGEKASWQLEPRSLLIFTKDSRSTWTHGIAQRSEDIWEGKTFQRERRVALTLRKVKFNVAKQLYDALRKKK